MTNDSHIHLFERGFKGDLYPNAEIDEYENIRKLGRIDSALVIGYEGNERYKGNNSYILKLAMAHPWIHPLGFIDPSSNSANIEIVECLESGFSGCALYLSEKSERLSENVISALHRIGERGAILSINANPTTIIHFRDQFAQLSTCKILISHMGLPGSESLKTQAQIRERIGPLLDLAKLPNLFVKLSGFYAVDPIYPYIGARPYVCELLETFGASRLMWGSDYSPSMGYGTQDQVATVPKWITEEMAEDEYESVTVLNLQDALITSAR